MEKSDYDDKTTSLFIRAIALLVVAGFAWEIFWRRGGDPIVLSTLTFLCVIPLAGKAAVRLFRAVRE